MSSQIAHNLRVNTFEHVKKLLKQKRKLIKDDVILEIMHVSMFSEVTARRYIRDMVRMGIAKNNGDFLEYIFDGKNQT